MKKRGLKAFGKKLFGYGGGFETEEFSPETHYAVIRSSICTGEKTAGFRDKKTGSFTEIMLIRSTSDIEEFKRKYKVETIKTEY